MRLDELLGDWYDVPARHAGLEVGGIAGDSRRVSPGDLFVAVRGETVDGHSFVRDAVGAGAVAVIGDRRPTAEIIGRPRTVPYLRVPDSRAALGRVCASFHRDPSSRLDVVGVTGTKGKTTTTWLLDSILRGCGAVPALFGTVENRVAGRVIPSRNTTPGILDLQSWLAEHRAAGGSHAILEVSSHAICQHRIAGIRLRCAALTNISPEHLDYHGTFESYRDAKASLFSALDPDAFAVLSREDPSAPLIARSTAARVVWYGGGSQDGVERLRLSHEGMTLLWKGTPVRSRLLGYHNVLNALAALAVADCLGLERERIAAAIAEAPAPPGRLEDVVGSRPFRVVVDYAHTDGALNAVLKTLRDVTPGRLITVFGCGGDRDRTKRPRMGRAAERWSDQIVVTSDNPRGEPPERILEDIRAGLQQPAEAEFIVDRREAIGLGVRMAAPGDTVLIAGKGHETYQEFADRTVEFDDRVIAREFLEESLLGCTPEAGG